MSGFGVSAEEAAEGLRMLAGGSSPSSPDVDHLPADCLTSGQLVERIEKLAKEDR